MKTLLYSFFCLSFLVLTTQCQKTKKNTLVVHIIAEPDDLHPTNGTSAIRAEINLYIHLSLLRLNYKTGELVPYIVKALPTISENGLHFTYELKDGVTWDDQSPVMASDVAFTAKINKCLYTNNPSLKGYWDNIRDVIIDPMNPKKFTVIMKHPYLLNTWFWTDFPIVQEAWYDSKKTLSRYTNQQLTDSAFLNTRQDLKQWADTFNSAKYCSHPTYISGGGAYRVTAWDKGVSLTLEKKQNHWSELYQETIYCQSYPDKIIFKLNNNNASTKLDLKNGLIDVSTQVDFSTFSELSKDSNFTKKYVTRLAETYNYTYIALNTKPDGQIHKNLFDDLAVRQAMALLVPYEQINKLLYNNHNKRMVGPVSPLKTDFNPDLQEIDYNIEKASALLKQAGWEDTNHDQVLDKRIHGEKVNLEFSINFLSTQKQWEELAKQLAESMLKANVYAKLNPLDYSSFVTAATTHDFDMSIGAWQTSAQPDDFSQLWHRDSWRNNGLNFSGFGNEQSDALIDSINHSTEENKRIKLSRQFQKMVYDEQAYIFLFTQMRRVVVSKKWENLEIYNEYPGVLLNTLKLKH